MVTNRLTLIGISLLVIIGVGIYFGKNAIIDSLSGGNGNQSSMPATNASGTLAASIKNCSFETSEEPEHTQVILNEIAWMGNQASTNNEWIELKNISSHTTDISGWRILNQNEKIKIIFKNGAKIPASDFYLLERGGADFLPDIQANAFFRGTLKNSSDRFRLFDKDCRLIDQVLTVSSWPAGDNKTKKTMERDSKTFAWHTSGISGGTPKKENTHVATTTKTTAAKTEVQPAVSQPPIASPPTPARSNVDHILISQLQTTGETGHTDNDFIELYNPTDERFNIKGYRVVKRTEAGTSDTLIKSWTIDTFIPAYGFYLWANSGYTTISVPPDSTTTGGLADNNGIAIRYGANDTGIIIDSVAWGKAENSFVEGTAFSANPGANQSMLRRNWQDSCLSASFDTAIGNGCDTKNNASDFELVQHSNPRNSKSR